MRISILADNRTLEPKRFRTEHGLAVLLQTADRQILLDTGASDAFLLNAGQTGIDLSAVDYVFLSHGHTDHAGGLPSFLQVNKKAKVIVSAAAVNGSFFSAKGGLHSITPLWPKEEMEGRTIYVGRTEELLEGFGVIASIPQNHPLPKGDRNLMIRKGGKYYPDTFDHEMALYVDGFLFTGCAHNGLENILDACPWPVSVVLGGFHLLDSQGVNTYESEEELKWLAGLLVEKYPKTSFYTSHCTGDNVFRTLKSVMGEHLQHFYCGEQFEISTG